MDRPETENSILEQLRQKKEGIRYIHVYPGDIKVYSLLEGTIKNSGEDRRVCEIQMIECSRESLTGFQKCGTPIPVTYVELPADRQGEDLQEFLKVISETGFLIDTGDGMYAVSHTAMKKLHGQMEMYGSFDFSPIHDLMLAEKLLAVEPCRLRHNRKKSLERVDWKNAKGYTLAVCTDLFEGSTLVDGIVMGLYSGWYEGMEGEYLESLCRRLAGGDIIKGKAAELTAYCLLEDGVEAEFMIGEPLRYLISGKEHMLTAGMMITDSCCGYRAFSIRGIISDPDAGDSIIVSEKKRSHYGYAGSGTAGKKTETDEMEDRILGVWEETEDFIGLMEECTKMPEENACLFQEYAVSAGIRECIGKKRTAALFSEPPGSVKEALHRIIHTKSAVTAAEGIKNLARQDEEKLKKVIACAVREAYRTLKVHGGTFTKKERERREGGSALKNKDEKDSGTDQDDGQQVQADCGGRTADREKQERQGGPSFCGQGQLPDR